MKIVEFKDYDNQTTPLSAYNLNRLQQNLITTKYQMTFSSAVSGGSTITLPCYYQVGQDTLDVYLNSELLKKASTKDSEGHYYEVGNSDTKSNQIKITSDWSIASGDVLNLIVRGTTDSYDQNLSPDKATQLADEISANKEEITALQTENSRLIRPKIANQQKVIDQLPQVTGQGTSITLENTIEAQFTKFDVEGNSEQETRSGKNYLNMFTKYKAGDTTTINGIKFTLNKDGSITCDGTASANATLDFSIPNGGQKINGTDKKLVGLIGGEYSYTKAMSCLVYDENWGNTKYISLESANKNSTQVMADNIEYSRFRIIVYKDTVINNRTLYLQVLDALQEDLSYEQYGASPSPDYPSEVESCGDNENLFDITTAINGFIQNGAISANANWELSQHIEVKNNSSYTMSRSDGTRQSFVITEYDENKTLIKRNEQGLKPDGYNSPYTITTGATTKYIRINYNNTFQATTIKLEKGNKASGYSPYGMGSINEKIKNADGTEEQTYTIPTQQPMRSIGDVRDCFVKIDGVWYEKHNIGQIVLNGTESGWSYDSDNFYFRTSNYTFEHTPKTNRNDTVQLSNYFKHTSGWGTFRSSHTTNLFYSVQNSGYKLCFRNVDITTVSDWTNWLQNHNVEVIYPTEEPYYLECTEEQTRQLENKPSTYKEMTIINSEDETKAYLEVSGIYDLNNLINNFIRKEI